MHERRTDLIHVTQVLRDAGLVNTEWFTDHMRERGTALHSAIEFDVAGDLDEATLDPEITVPFAAWRKFRAEMQPEILASELNVEVPGSYCGRLDLLVRINDAEGIVDFKGQPSPSDSVQLAGYACTFDRPLKRWNLYLRIGNGYRLVEHKDRRRDDSIWRAALVLAAWRREHGLVT